MTRQQTTGTEDRTQRIAGQWADHTGASWSQQERDRRLGALLVLGRVQRIQADADLLLRPLFARAGLDDGAFEVLTALRRSGPDRGLTPAQLKEAMLVTGSAVTKRVDRLITQGLVSRQRADADGRSRVVALTSQGLVLADELIAAHLDKEADLLEDLDDEQLGHLAELLAVLARSLERRSCTRGIPG